jgi:hypothetical protein
VGAASAVLDDAVLDVGDPGRLDRAHLLDLEVADVLEQPLAVPEQDRDEVQLELVHKPGGQVLLLNGCTSTGGRPRGAHVRRTLGVRLSALSSKMTIGSVAGCDCGFDVIEESLKYQVMKRLDPLTPDRLVLPDRAALDRVAKHRRAFCKL